MNAILSVLGAAMLVLVSIAAILAIVILVLYEARWIIRISGQLGQSGSMGDQLRGTSEPTQQQLGGE